MIQLLKSSFRFRGLLLGLSLCAAFAGRSAFAQEGIGATAQVSLPADSNRTHVFFAPNGGIGFYNFRDRATSPLTYAGVGFHGGILMQWLAPKYQLTIGGDFAFARLFANVPESNYFQSGAVSTMYQLNFEAIYLRRLQALASAKMDYLLGGGILGTGNLRSNPSLFNNGTGIEAFGNLIFAAKATRDISRKEAKTWKIWFININLKPVQRRISVQAHAGVLNFNYRPGYAYSTLPEIDGTNTTGLEYQLTEHAWKMNGWRLGGRVAYTRYTARGNGHQLSYHWDALHAPGRHAIFEMASHRIGYTLLFNAK